MNSRKFFRKMTRDLQKHMLSFIILFFFNEAHAAKDFVLQKYRLAGYR